MMDKRLNRILEKIGDEFSTDMAKGGRHYLEVSIGKHAEALGYSDLGVRYATTFSVIPLKNPKRGMKVRIDGRTFVNYAQYESGVVVPGYLAREVEKPFTVFVPADSMICNFA